MKPVEEALPGSPATGGYAIKSAMSTMLGLGLSKGRITAIPIVTTLSLVLYIALQEESCNWYTSSSNSFACNAKATILNPLHATNKSRTQNNSNGLINSNKNITDLTDLSHIVFGLAATAKLWETRKNIIKLWWNSTKLQGYAWLDKMPAGAVGDDLPELRVSGDISKLPGRRRDGIRIARAAAETFRLAAAGKGDREVRWIVMGDDDTVFAVENMVRVLRKFDHRQMYYIGNPSESHAQNLAFSYGMAFGGGGFALSWPAAEALSLMVDSCLKRYPDLYSSDIRIHACMSELGIPLTPHRGFHQYDVRGNLLGLMVAHPIVPFVSLHHVEAVEPTFPNMNRLQSLQHLKKSMDADTTYFLQQSICYDTQRKWSVSISWGFVVQIYQGFLPVRVLETPMRTFSNWNRRSGYNEFSFNTRPMPQNPCQKPFIFYMRNITTSKANKDGQEIVESYYERKSDIHQECKAELVLSNITEVKVVTHKDDTMWDKSPRRKCCHVYNTNDSMITPLLILINNCKKGEVIAF